MYDYAVEQFGQMGAPGVDYGMPYGTPIFTPVGGTVTHSGGTGYYNDDGGGVGFVAIAKHLTDGGCTDADFSAQLGAGNCSARDQGLNPHQNIGVGDGLFP